MRLTNVAQMDLVGGRVFSYGVRAAADAGIRVPISFDQARHVGGGQRPGSWMALALRLAMADVSMTDLALAWDDVVARHGTLRTVFSQDDGQLRLEEIAMVAGTWEEHPVPEGRLTREVLRNVFDARCAPFERPSHRLCLVRPGVDDPDQRPEVVIAADHAHVDMWSLAILARDLLGQLAARRSGQPADAAPLPIPGFAEHTALLEAMPTAPPQIEERWAAILDAGGGDFPVFPLPLGALSPVPAEVVEVRDVLDAAGTDRLTARASALGVRPIALGISVLTDVTRRMADRPLRAVFPVHSRHDAHWREACGWFITNAVLESGDPDPFACGAAVREATGLGSWPLAPILAAYGDLPAVPGMFAISWLDARRLPTLTPEASQVRYVSAAIRTDGVMIWFVVGDDGLHLRCRYPDTPEAREHVGRWLDAVEVGLREIAGEPLQT